MSLLTNVAQVASCAHPRAGLADKLTQELIEDGMARAEKVACRPGNDRWYALPYDVESAHQTCTPQGRCKIGGTRRVIVANAGRDSWDVWLDVHTGEGRLRRRRT